MRWSAFFRLTRLAAARSFASFSSRFTRSWSRFSISNLRCRTSSACMAKMASVSLRASSALARRSISLTYASFLRRLSSSLSLICISFSRLYLSSAMRLASRSSSFSSRIFCSSNSRWRAAQAASFSCFILTSCCALLSSSSTFFCCLSSSSLREISYATICCRSLSWRRLSTSSRFLSFSTMAEVSFWLSERFRPRLVPGRPASPGAQFSSISILRVSMSERRRSWRTCSFFSYLMRAMSSSSPGRVYHCMGWNCSSIGSMPNLKHASTDRGLLGIRAVSGALGSFMRSMRSWMVIFGLFPLMPSALAFCKSVSHSTAGR
mmetsp:Transcript_36136/g.80420  ORF Transcript_36136/g.80420 Transcript_36136/m.80420 type:complete len:321 (+) Transcript_36136:1437-2399(+)